MKIERIIGFRGVLIASLFAALSTVATAEELPLPPQPNPPGEPQPEFGAAEGHFTFDGKPGVILSGSIHYPRVPRAYWRDRIRKAKAMGFNCIGTYIFWNAHEKKPGEFDFSGNLDVAAFARVCQEEGMWLIVRPGPYICAEWNFGALPPWLLKEPDIRVRTTDPRFMAATTRYFNALGEQLKDLQVNRGGPILQVQVENEYGQFGEPGNPDDMAYNRAIYDQLVAAGFDTMFIRCDWPVKETIGTAHIDGVYTTMNFGGSAEEAFSFFDQQYPGMPRMSGEYWVGWFDTWGQKHHTKSLAPFIEQIEWMLDHQVSFNVYMLHGGTNFGFTPGADWVSSQYCPDTTCYDYDAPIDEMGRITEKFYTFRDTLRKYLPSEYDIPEPPAPARVIEIPEFELTQTAGFEQLFRKPFSAEHPPHLEAIDQTQGLALYRTEVTVDRAGDYPLQFSELKDRAIVIVNGRRAATIDRRLKQNSTQIALPAGTSRLEVLLENMGYINYSREMLKDRKGLGEVTLDGQPVLDWLVYSCPLELADIAGLDFNKPADTESPLPVFYRGEFTVDEVGDTLLDMTGWGKGMVWVNGVNLGRFWDIGPQHTQYLPGCWMKPGANEVIVMEIEPQDHTTLRGITKPIFGLKIDKKVRCKRQPDETIQLDAAQLMTEGEFTLGDKAQDAKFDEVVEARYLCLESLGSLADDNRTVVAEIDLLGADGKLLDRNGWQVIYADSEELAAEPGSADNVLDGQAITVWCTQYEGKGADTPTPPSDRD